MITARQLRLARAVLEMNQQEFSDAVGVSVPTLQRLEKQDGELQGLTKTIRKIENTLENYGVVFVEDGVVIKKHGD